MNTELKELTPSEKYRPTYWSVDKSIICSAIAVIKSGLDYAESALVEHDSALGRTTRKNRTWAETIEGDIREMKKVLTQLGALPEPQYVKPVESIITPL